MVVVVLSTAVIAAWWTGKIPGFSRFGVGPRSDPGATAGALRGYNVLLVTIDTLRADRVGAYGSALGLTPTLDRLAHDGWRFATTYAHVPLTLPSHATLLTGTYPFTNGVRDNGSFRLDDSRPTLATALAAAGYRRAAFVGAFVLDARFGLNRGFDFYDDRMLGTGSSLEVVQRPAEAVLAPAASWILQPPVPSPQPSTSARDTSTARATVDRPAASNPPSLAPRSNASYGGPTEASNAKVGQQPFFAWIHLYDPHEPYAPPEPYRSRYPSDPYAGEIAYADASLGSFLDRLKGAGALDRTLVIVASDHGESLGEHGERTHGLFAYDATLRVPLILWTASATRPLVVSAPARLVDVTPTILDLVGAPPITGVDGRSVRPFVAGERPFDAAPSYFEALNANLTRGWAPLRGVVSGQLKLIDLPLPELYDLAADPHETNNLYPTEPRRARDLEASLDRLTAGAAVAAAKPVDPDAAARLRSLGYVTGTAAKPKGRYVAGDDPKRLVHLNQALDDAAARWERGDSASAIDTLQQVVRERPDLTTAYDRLAFMLQATGRLDVAIRTLDEAARAGHADAAMLRSLGSLLRDAGQLPRAASVLEALVQQNGDDVESLDALGQTYTRMRRWRDAETMFRRVLRASPNASATWTNLGVLYLTANDGAQAVEALSRAIAIDPALAGAHNVLGVAYARQGDIKRAVDEWREAVRLRPDFEDARANLEKVGARD